VWVLIVGDMVMFSIFFITFMYYRSHDVALYIQSQTRLNQALGAVNTGLMLTSSWFVATAMWNARRTNLRAARLWLILAMLCGLTFCALKVFEYHEKIGAGITLQTNDFFMFYFMFTGIHCLHVVLGTGVLGFMTLYLRARAVGDAQIHTLETGASFWHLVDLLWIVLFALLYLIK
jgi:nitric oxide reductase NorE protein